MDDLSAIRSTALEAVRNAADLGALEAARVAVLGKKGSVTGLMKTLGGLAPDQRKEFGDTNLLVVKPEEGASLARALGQHWMVLMNRHGVTAAGISVRDTVFRCIYSCRNAEYQITAAGAGVIGPLSPGEVQLTSKISTQTTGLGRAWEYWVHRLAKSGGLPPTNPSSSSRKRPAASTRKKAGARLRQSAKGRRR